MLEGMIKANRDVYLKKYFFDILKSRYSKNEKIIERILFFLTDSDLKEFSSFVADIYETAYLKCVEDHKKSLENIGYKVNVVEDQSKDGVTSEGMHS